MIVNDATGAKSTAAASSLPATSTTTSVGIVRALTFRVAVTATAVGPSPSSTSIRSTVSVMSVDGSSSSTTESMICSESFCNRNGHPDIFKVASISSTESSSGSSVNVAVPLGASAAIVIVRRSSITP